MKRTAMVTLAIGIALTGLAGANPLTPDQLSIDFDPPYGRSTIYPEPFSAVNAYVVFQNPYWLADGFNGVAFALQLTPGMASSVEFSSLLPGNLYIGTWETGITLASTQCIDEFPATIGVLSFVYEGIPGDVLILDHPETPRLMADCSYQTQVYNCVYANGGVGKPCIYGDCGVDPVRNVSWSSIKALYE
jgi:hypothetical protein